MKKDKVKKFNPYGRPHVGHKPRKTKEIQKTIWSGEFESYSKIDLPANITGGHFEVGRISSGDFGSSVEIKYVVIEEVENKNYDRDIKNYEKALEAAEKWDAEKKIYDDEQKRIERDKEYKKYLQLKKKYKDWDSSGDETSRK